MTDPPEFKKGDKVRWKLGGPSMTVEEVYDPCFLYRYRCRWTDQDGFERTELYKSDDLVAAPPPTA